MHGFFGSYEGSCQWDLSAYDADKFVSRTHSTENFELIQVTLPKFLEDKYFVEQNDCFLATEGVLFEADCAVDSINRFLHKEETFWNSWRGSFAGVLYDKSSNTLYLFNDHIGSKMLFYVQTEKGFFFASDIFVLAHSLGINEIDEKYLWQLLIYGYSPIGETVYSRIRRIQAGEFILVRGAKVECKTYHRFDNTPNHLSFEENIERIDSVFRQAVARAIRKNEQYGYTHFLPLSAGLDSRMTNCVAHEIAKTPIHNITYSQSAFYDETTPRELSAYWHNEFHFTPLDSGECLMPLDEVSEKTCGLVHYSGAAETLYGLPDCVKKQSGVFLTGMVGDIIVGTAYTKRDRNQSYHMGEGAILPEKAGLIQDVFPFDFERRYPNRELYYLYVRGFNCANLGSPLIHQHFGESYSPFCDVDVLEAAYAIPLEQRWNNCLYDQWIISKYPDMLRWKHNGIYTIGQRPRLVSIYGRALTISEIPKRIVWYALKKLHIHNFYQESEGKSMNPEDDWFAQNTALRQWSEEYIQANMALIEDFPKLQGMAKTLSHGTAMERMQVLSLLACLRQTR